MHIYIPSRGRAHLLGMNSKCTLRHISREWLPRVTYVVPSAEAAQYRRKLNNLSLEVVSVLECNDSPISKKRLWIATYHPKKDPTFGMLDDDLQFLCRVSSSTSKVRVMEAEGFTAMMEWVESQLSRGISHVGISPRELNHDMKNPDGTVMSGNPDDIVLYNYRTQRALFYRVQDYLSVEHGRVPVMEDFDVNLQMLRRGMQNALGFYWAQGQGGDFGMEGGCSVYRTLEMHNAAARELARLHPGLVRLRQKTTKGIGELGTRTEVTISWKKAFGAT